MNADGAAKSLSSPYASRTITKAPNWHGLVAWDILFNNLAAGIFLVAGLGELLLPEVFTTVATIGYPIALVWLTADLICLVLDLGDPWRFHHMLRVVKPSSPMSLGTWSLTAFALPLTLLALLSVLPFQGTTFVWLRRVIVVLGLLPAFGAAIYKGVLFSTSAQPGWQHARWLGAYLATSAFVLGGAFLLGLSVLMGEHAATAVLRHSVTMLLVLNALSLAILTWEFRAVLNTPEIRSKARTIAWLGAGAGLALPLGLFLVGTSLLMFAGVVLLVLGALIIRYAIVLIPHVYSHT